jgi:amidase
MSIGTLLGAAILFGSALGAGASVFGRPDPRVPRTEQRIPSPELDEATIASLQQKMQVGSETSRSLVEKYLARIDAIDRSGPALHSVLETNPDALTIADQLDAERKTRGPRGALHGIPILLKDNIATADKMMTTAGSLALAGTTSPKDAFIVERLRAAGAVIIGDEAPEAASLRGDGGPFTTLNAEPAEIAEQDSSAGSASSALIVVMCFGL